METYYINRADTTKPDGTPLQTRQGKPFKKLELKADSDQYPKKGVVIWSDHPNFADAVAGGHITCDLNETDSGTPNPKAPGKNYINRSVAMPGEARQQQTDNTSTYDLKTHITQEIAPVKEALRAIVDHLGVEKPVEKVGNTNVDYPPMDETNNGEINPDTDVPF